MGLMAPKIHWLQRFLKGFFKPPFTNNLYIFILSLLQHVFPCSIQRGILKEQLLPIRAFSYSHSIFKLKLKLNTPQDW
jgi:hypothetical protein